MPATTLITTTPKAQNTTCSDFNQYLIFYTKSASEMTRETLQVISLLYRIIAMNNNWKTLAPSHWTFKKTKLLYIYIYIQLYPQISESARLTTKPHSSLLPHQQHLFSPAPHNHCVAIPFQLDWSSATQLFCCGAGSGAACFTIHQAYGSK